MPPKSKNATFTRSQVHHIFGKFSKEHAGENLTGMQRSEGLKEAFAKAKGCVGVLGGAKKKRRGRGVLFPAGYGMRGY